MKTPQFLYVPHANTREDKENTKFIIETRNMVFWQVLEFADIDARTQFYYNAEKHLSETALAVNFNKTHPIMLICLKVGSEIKQERLVSVGNRACDWYVQFWLRNKKLSQPPKESKELKKASWNWIWGNNMYCHPDYSYLINMEHGCIIKFNYTDSFNSSFEAFETQIADVQFWSGIRPGERTIHDLIIDAWSFLCIEERIADNDNLQ